MDLLKELRDVRQAVEDALEDGRITFLEALLIVKEAVEVMSLLTPVIRSGPATAQEQPQDAPPSK